MEEKNRIWQLTAVRIQGLRLMRPERSWRPVITVEIDKHHAYEYSMGCDGQNPNIKDVFQFHDASPSSVLDVRIWHKPQTKKKSKKRHLVARATHSLGELLKRQEIEHKVEIRLQCESKHAKASKAKSQSGALFHIRLRPPPSLSKTINEIPDVRDTNNNLDSGHATPDEGYTSDQSITSESSDTLTDPPSPVRETLQVAHSCLRRRRIRGYAIFSDDEIISEEYTSDDAEESAATTKVPPSSSSIQIFQDGDDVHEQDYHKHHLGSSGHEGVLAVYKREIHISDAEWVAASILPLHVVEVKTPETMNAAEEVLASFTVYKEMKEATGDSQLEKVFCRLQQEWTYVGGLLVALAALNTAAFSLSRNPVSNADQWCRCAVASSSISTGLGIACDTWFLFRYSWANLDTFRLRAKDLFDSYFFFCLSARVPALCMVISGVSLMLFLGLVAYEAWPQAVLVISFFIGLIMTLQFLAFTAHWCAMKIVRGGKAGSRHIVTVVQRIRKQ